MTFDGVELRWIQNRVRDDRILQYRMCTRSVNGITGLRFGHTSWEDVPTVMEEDDD